MFSEINTFHIIILLNICSSLFSVFLAVTAFKMRNNKVAFYFGVLMCIFATWGILKLSAIFIHSLNTQIVIFHFVRGITIFSPGLVLLIIIYYLKQPTVYINYFAKFLLGVAIVLSILSFGNIFTYDLNDQYQIIYQYHIPILSFPKNMFSFVYIIYLYFCLVSTILILIQNLFLSSPYFKKQLTYIILAIAIPAINDLLFRFNISLIENYHLTPEFFAIGNFFFAQALWGYNFLKVIPITRRVVIDSIEDVMITTNPDDIIIDINVSCKKIFHLKNRDVIGKLFSEVFTQYENLIKLYKAGQRGEIFIQISDRFFYFSIKQSKVVDDKDRKLATIMILHDITESRLAQQQIKESEAKFRFIFNNLYCGLALIDKEGKYVTVNPTFTTLTGYGTEELFSTRIGNLTHPDDKETVINTFQEILKPEIHKASNEARVINKNAEVLWIFFVASKYYNSHGEFEYIMIEFYDITNIKNAELQLKKYSIELEKTNATKDRFFSIIAHDLRNPFAGLIGVSSLMLEDIDSVPDDSFKELIQVIHESAQKGHKLLETLLEWARVQTQTIQFNPMPVLLRSIVSETVDIVKVSAIKKNIVITNRIPAEDIYIYVDYYMIQTVLRNLISNAIKFTNHHGNITICADNKVEQNKVEISVIDSGIGIKEEDMDKIFRIDTKTSNPGTDNEPGTGLGLILCKEFVLINQGEILIHSKIKEGTKVILTVPIWDKG
jgi:PAS domain S-box-containing protein